MGEKDRLSTSRHLKNRSDLELGDLQLPSPSTSPTTSTTTVQANSTATPFFTRLRRLSSTPHRLPLVAAQKAASVSISLTNRLVLLTLLLFLYKVLPLPYITPPISLIHPLPSLLSRATRLAHSRAAAEPRTLSDAYHRYRTRHGRPPPQGYDAWFNYAKKHRACRIDGFEEMYRSLEVWWGVKPEEIRERIEAMGVPEAGSIGRVRVREGRVVKWGEMLEEGVPVGDVHMEEQYARTAWEEMLETLLDQGERLPDVDFFVNQLDEPRVVIPYELRTELEARGRKGKPRDPVPESLVLHDSNAPSALPSYAVLRRSCAPNSLARRTPLSPSPGEHPHVSPRYTTPFTLSPKLGSFLSDPAKERQTWCDQPDLQELHQTFIHPLSFSWTDGLFPVFSNSKIEGFNDILVPVWYHWYQKMPYVEEEDVEWKGKSNQMYWRGTNTGGRSISLNWFGWLRSRLVSKLNRLIEWGHYDTVLLPLSNGRTASATLPSTALNAALTDVAFQAPDHHGDPASLEQQTTEPSFRFVENGEYTPFSNNYLYKLLLDLDGTAYSGRFPTFMASNSAVVRSNLFISTFDDSLIPYYHYLPLSLRLSELYNLLAYFFGIGSVPSLAAQQGFPPSSSASTPSERDALRRSEAHEEELWTLAKNGKNWANECARREDALIHAYLMCLEWARLAGEGRDGGRWDMRLE